MLKYTPITYMLYHSISKLTIMSPNCACYFRITLKPKKDGYQKEAELTKAVRSSFV